MSNIGFIPIARPTFDTALAQELTTQLRSNLVDAGFDLLGDDTLIMSMDAVDAWVDGLPETPALLLVVQASFADSTMIVRLAERVDAPILMWALPEPQVGGRLRLNSFCGINLGGHALTRAGYSYDYLYTTPDDPAAITKVTNTFAAAVVKERLQATRIGRIGENPDGFETCLVNYEALETQFGVDVVQVELETVFAGMQAAPEADVNTAYDAVSARVAGVDKFDRTETNGTLSAYVTMRSMANEMKLDGLAVRCWPEFFTGPGCSACGAMSMLNDSQMPCSCEADVNGTITSLILQWLSGDPAFGTDIVAFDTEDDTATLWHCGLAPLSMADPDSTPEAALHSNRQKPLLMQFPLKPGRITLARLSEATGEMRLVIGTGEMIKAPPSFTGTSGRVRFDSGAQQAMDTMLQEGLEHHLSLTYGDYADTLEALARMLKLPVLRL